MKGMHDDISQTFSNFYQDMVRPYHCTMSGVIFFKHVFQFSIVEKSINDVFLVDSFHTYPSNMCPFFVKRMRIY